MKLRLIVHNVRSSHNVGSLLRSAEGLGLERVHLSGYTPYPSIPGDERLPHLAAHLTRMIHKTALGAEITQPWQHDPDTITLIEQLQQQGYLVIALEQTEEAVALPRLKLNANARVALLVGSEVGGLDTAVLKATDQVVEIPMFGRKESYNVAVAAAIGLYHLRFMADRQ